jgi:hypothetical protein
MTQEERWLSKYNEVKTFIEENHRNSSKYVGAERNVHTFIKHAKKQQNQGVLKENRIEEFKELLELMEENKHVNQYK